MTEGGIIGNGALTIDWYPKEEFDKKWYKTLRCKNCKNPEASIASITKLLHTWDCPSCNKVVGIFDTYDL